MGPLELKAIASPRECGSAPLRCLLNVVAFFSCLCYFSRGDLALAQETPPKLYATIESTEEIGTVRFSPDSKTLAIQTGDDTVLLWDVGARKVRSKLEKGLYLPMDLAFSPDGKSLAIANSSVRLINLSTGKSAELYRHKFGVGRVAFSADGKMLASCGSTGAKVWDVSAGKELDSFVGAEIVELAFLPDGRSLVLCGGKTAAPSMGAVWIWEFGTKKSARVLGGYSHAVIAVAVSPDGKTLVTKGDNGDLWVWNADMGTLRAKWNVGIRARALTFSPSGKLLVVAGSEGYAPGRVAFVDVEAGRKVTSFEAFARQNVGWMSLSPDGRLLAVSAEQVQRKMKVYDVAPVLLAPAK